MSTARVLIIAGSDSGGGAGIQADIKTVTMLGGHAMTAITAITAQNTIGVHAVHAVPTEMVIDQIRSVINDIGVDAIKIGMIGSAETAHAVADFLQIYGNLRDARDSIISLSNSPQSEAIRRRIGEHIWMQSNRLALPIIFDPVMVATSGDTLADKSTIDAFERLMQLALLVTPNTSELDALGGEEAVLSHGAALLVKGGHDDGEQITDRLVRGRFNGKTEIASWTAPRINTTSTHGTGCTLASAIATGIAQGLPLEPAVARARDFVRVALHNAPGLGQGHGPLGQQAVRNDGLFTGPALNQITLASRDYAASVAFFRLLGLTQIVDSPTNGYARFEAANGVTLSIHADEAMPQGAVTYLESGALDAWCAYLARQGVRFDSMPRDESWGWREARLTDPAGNRLCLYQAAEYRRFPPWRIDA